MNKIFSYFALLPRRDLCEQHVEVFLGARKAARLLVRIDVILLDSFFTLPLDCHQSSILSRADFYAASQAITAEVALNQNYFLEIFLALLSFLKRLKAYVRLDLDIFAVFQVQKFICIAKVLSRAIVARILVNKKVFQP